LAPGFRNVSRVARPGRLASSVSTRAAALVCLAASLLACCGCGDKAGDEEAQPAEVPTITASVATVTSRTLVDGLTVRGTVTAVPNEDVRVSALVPGRLTAVTVAEGDSVRKGQVIAAIDSRPLQEEQRKAAAAVGQAKAQIENARLNLQRTDALFQRGIAAGKEVEDARAQMASAQAALEQATAALEGARLQLARTDVRAPISGQVVKRMVSVGEQVDGTGAQPIVEIANVDHVELAASVPPEHLSQVRIGQKATVSTEAYPGTKFPAEVIAIAPAVDSSTNTALVRIRIVNSERQLKVGMFGEGRLELAEHRNVLVVPPSAVVKRDAAAFVYVVTGDTAERRPVKIGLEQADAVEVLSGLTAGQTVLTSAVYGLGEKAKLARSRKEG
jgi:membrane fusion protein (multidrug efflux system)